MGPNQGNQKEILIYDEVLLKALNLVNITVKHHLRQDQHLKTITCLCFLKTDQKP